MILSRHGVNCGVQTRPQNPETNKAPPTPQDMLQLADAYAAAAVKLDELRPKGKGNVLGQAPFRFAAMHAIELYLTAVLLAQGNDAKQLTKLRHDLRARLEKADVRLRDKTVKHLNALTDHKEYRATRYQPQDLPNLTPLTAVTGALQDVRKKAHTELKRLQKAQTPRVEHR